MKSQSVTPLVHSIPEACARLGVGKTMFFELLHQGHVRSIKIGRRTLIPESELVRLVDERVATTERTAA